MPRETVQQSAANTGSEESDNIKMGIKLIVLLVTGGSNFTQYFVAAVNFSCAEIRGKYLGKHVQQ